MALLASSNTHATRLSTPSFQTGADRHLAPCAGFYACPAFHLFPSHTLLAHFLHPFSLQELTRGEAPQNSRQIPTPQKNVAH